MDVQLKYGPVGDPNSTDRWERTQARMPDGWHVEGQIVPTSIGHRADASRKDVGILVTVYGRTPDDALEKLVDQVHAATA
jgi:hypothetical protein